MIATSFGPEDTYALGKRLGEAAKAGDVFCLNGDLAFKNRHSVSQEDHRLSQAV